MDTSRMKFCAFSPLRSPDVKLKRKKVKKNRTFDSLISPDSDLESVVSVVTKDIRKIVQSVNTKLNQQQQSDSEVDFSPKEVNMKHKAMSDDSTDLDSSSESDFEQLKSPSKKRKLDNTISNNKSLSKESKLNNGKKKDIASDSSDSEMDSDVSSLLLKSPKKAVIKNKTKVNMKSHEIRESGGSDVDDIEEKKKAKKKVESPKKKVIESPKKKIVELSKKKVVESSDTDISDSDNENKKKVESPKKKVIKLPKKKAVSESSDTKFSDSDNEDKEVKKKVESHKKYEVSPEKKVIGSSETENSDSGNKEKRSQKAKNTPSDIKKDNYKSTKEIKNAVHKTLASSKKKVVERESSNLDSSDSGVEEKQTYKMNESKIVKEKGANESTKPATKSTVSPKKKVVASDSSDSDDGSKNDQQTKKGLRSPVKMSGGKSPLKETARKSIDDKGSNSDSDSSSTGLESDSDAEDDTEKSNSSRSKDSRSKGVSPSKKGKGMNSVNFTQEDIPESDKSDLDKSDSDQIDSDKSVSDDEQETRSPMKSASSKHGSLKSANTSFSTPKLPVSSSKTGAKNMRFQIPEKFEIETEVTTNCLKYSDIKGKKLWLIQAPRELDISTLKGRKINMSGSSVISSKEEDSEKQYEVNVRPFSGGMTDGYQTLTALDNQQLSIGLRLHGQINISNWIPNMPPVEKIKPEKHKHIVPDNLSSSFQLFGSDSPPHSPVKYSQEESHKKSKKAKKHKKSKTELMDDTPVSQDDSMISSSMEEVSSAKKKKKKHKHKHE